jgi:glycine/D-amino acid oxidase-like deaminating enzyme
VRLRERVAVQRTGQLMYELSTLYPDISGILPEYGWDAAYARTSDGLPYIGPHRNFPHHLFALGDSSRSLTGAYLASRMLLRHHLDELESADRHFSFTRHGG